MNDAPSLNTRAILLLTAPLIIGRTRRSSAKPLAAGEYNRLAHRLRELRRQPADLLRDGARALLEQCRVDLDPERARRLLDRGFLLSQAMERWRTRALWVTSRADAQYPRRLKKRLREQAPPVLYGCGNRADLDSGGLAVVGSRNVNDDLIAYTEDVGRLAARARRALVSGGARGIDQAAMRGALEAGGKVACVLADGLERAATRREHRDALMDERLVLICPYDPAAGFLVGHAMQRNKLIYALADAALVVSAEFEKGGTWAGAVEQLDRHRFVSVYVRASGEIGPGLGALLARGARPWQDVDSPADLNSLLDAPPEEVQQPGLASVLHEVRTERDPAENARRGKVVPEPRVVQPDVGNGLSPAQKLLAAVKRPLLSCLDEPSTEEDVAETLDVPPHQARSWLKRLTADGVVVLDKSKPPRYRAADAPPASPILPSEGLSLAAAVLAGAKESLLPSLDEPRSAADVAHVLEVQKNTASNWLKRMAADGTVEKLRGARYQAAGARHPTPLFSASGSEERTRLSRS